MSNGDVIDRPPTEEEIDGMVWWNQLSLTAREAVLFAAENHTGLATAAECYRLFGGGRKATAQERREVLGMIERKT